MRRLLILIFLLYPSLCSVSYAQPASTATPKENAYKAPDGGAAAEGKAAADGRAAADGKASLIIPEQKAYVGAYIDFGERENEVSLEKIENFERLVDRKQAIVAFSDEWGAQSFPEWQLSIISGYGAVPLVYWLPWQDRRIDGEKADKSNNPFSFGEILAGKWDHYLDSWGEKAAQYGKPFFVSFALEMNGDWFPWSGAFHGAGTPIKDGSCQNCFEGPTRVVNGMRYVIDRVRAKGARNIIWVWHPNNTSGPDEPWNQMAAYYPGTEYCDWIALSAYGTQFPYQEWISVDDAIIRWHKKLAAVVPDKPIMLGEWGVGEFPKKGDRAAWLTEFFKRAPLELPRLKAMVFWHERWENSDLSHSNLLVNSSPSALKAYRQGIAGPFWLDRPQWSEGQRRSTH